MEVFEEFLGEMEHPAHRERMEEILSWIQDTFPQLEPLIKWNQPMFADHGTFIIGFSVSKKHIAFSPESVVIEKFSDDIIQSEYEHTKEIVRIPWNKPVDYHLLKNIIAFNIEDKADYTDFWRK